MEFPRILGNQTNADELEKFLVIIERTNFVPLPSEWRARQRGVSYSTGRRARAPIGCITTLGRMAAKAEFAPRNAHAKARTLFVRFLTGMLGGGISLQSLTAGSRSYLQRRRKRPVGRRITRTGVSMTFRRRPIRTS